MGGSKNRKQLGAGCGVLFSPKRKEKEREEGGEEVT